jgi:hypothetical protein
MRKLIVVLMLAVAALAGAVMAPQAQAQTEYPSVSGLTPFTQPANYMSLPGWLRYQHLLRSGRWISREEAVEAVRQQGAPVGPAPAEG